MTAFVSRFPYSRTLVVAALAAAWLAGGTAQAQGWVDVATISATIGNTLGRICTGGGKADIGCGVLAPVVTGTGAVGIGVVTPQALLDVSGTLKISNGSEACDNDRLGAIRYQGGSFEVCQSVTNGWEPLATLGAGSLADRITSGTTQVITNGASQSISFTVGGVTTGYFYNGQLVASGVSTTGAGRFKNVSVTEALDVGGVVTIGSATTVGGPLSVNGALAVGGGGTISGSLGVGSLYTSGTVTVSNTVTADRFVGDGSGLTNVPAGSITGLVIDRIVSGTSGIYVSDSSVVSFKTNGTTWGYLNTTGVLSLPGVSTTGVVSASSGFVANKLGVGVAAPVEPLEVAGAAKIAGSGSEVCGAVGDRGKMRLNPVSGKMQACIAVP